MKYELPKEKCYKCNKKIAKGWYETKPICKECFELIKKPARVRMRETVWQRKREKMGIICS